jgi:hypothetical protein
MSERRKHARAGERWPGYHSKPKPRVPVDVPKWVPSDYVADYLALADLEGEEAAASYVRGAKRAAAARR